MAESILKRVQRVVAAGAESVTDALEQASGASLLRQAIRELDRSADAIRTRQRATEARRQQAARQQLVVRDRLATLDEQARFAIEKGRIDLAEAALSRQLDFEGEMKRLKLVQSEASAEEAELAARLAEYRDRKGQMAADLAAFEKARSGAVAGGAKASGAERRAAQAEAVFDRVIEGTGGGPELAPVATAAKVAEAEALRRDAEIARRLETLRGAKAAKARKAPAKKTR